MIQSGRAWPGGTTFWARRVTRPSMFVVDPARSIDTAAGRTTSASRLEGLATASTATRKGTASSACLASLRSGKSARGSAPSRIRVPIWASAAASSIPAVSSPRPAGTLPQAAEYQSDASSSRTRPGSMPGESPMSRAPITLARRKAGRKRAPGQASASTAAAAASCSADSASEQRPITTTMPLPSGAGFEHVAEGGPGSVEALRRDTGYVGRARAGEAAGERHALAGPVAQRGGGDFRERRRHWGAVDDDEAVVGGGRPQA